MNGQRGITMIEILVIFSLIAIVGGFTLWVSMDTLRASVSRSDRDLIVSTLQRARSQSMNNMCIGTCTEGKQHGVKILAGSKKIVLFQGATYVTRDSSVDAAFDLNSNSVSGSDEVVFAQLSGTVSSQTNTTVTDARGQASVITVNPSGQIIWTH